ncbi:MAG: carboxypeptidase-like regulatory domain-containing protein [Terracidiphilus sp.]|jgi:hypothetical protein
MIHPLRTWFSRSWGQKRLWCAILWSAGVLLFVSAAWAQSTSSISGTVRDAADALVPGARVALINEASKATRNTTSNGDGFFNFLAVQPATYSIQVTMVGFETWKVTGIEVHPGDSLTVPKIKLKIGQIVESIVVTADVAGVTLDSPEHSTLITAADIARLSSEGRDALELVSMLPGFTLNAGVSLQNSAPDYTTTNFGSGQLGSFGANGSAPQQGLVNLSADGASVIDPGDMGATTANINMDQVQEVKIQTSNFGADEAKGPIVINAVGKSGGSTYHGNLYMYARNAIFDSNDWLSNDQGSVNPATGKYQPVAKTAVKYSYPGAGIGGPVKIPGTQFNKSKKLTFWAGYEQYVQTTNTNGTFSGPTFAFIPTPRMLDKDPQYPGYDLSSDSIAAAFNVNSTDLVANCTEPYSQTASWQSIGGDCFSPIGQTDQNGLPVTGGILNSINPAMLTFTKFYPTINRTPQPANGYVSDGYNWVQNVLATNNGFQIHSSVEDSLSDSLKLRVAYNWEKVNTEIPLNDIYYNPPSTIPYPAPLYSNGHSNWASVNLTKTFGASMTNELIAAGNFFEQPEQFKDRALASDTGTPWAQAGYSGGFFKNGNQLPRIYSWEGIGIPNFSMGYVPVGGQGQYLRKSSWDLADNFTKVYRTHTMKVGAYLEQTRNNQVTLGSDANGTILFDRYNGCLINQTTATGTIDQTTGAWTASKPPGTYMGNTVGNFLIGCPGGYNQSTSDPSLDMYFNSLEFYATDEWKVSSKLTITYGIRLSHLPPWMDSHGIGAAVWEPAKITPGVFYQNVTLDSKTFPGISWHQLDPSIPVAGMGTRALFYSPRVGLAYDLFGNGKTTLRGGWGAYRSRDAYQVASEALNTSIDVVDHGYSGNYSCTLDELMHGYYPTIPAQGAPPSAPSGQVIGCGFYGASVGTFVQGSAGVAHGSTISTAADDPNDSEQPLTYNYNFTLDQQIPWHTTLEVAYVGNASSNLVRQQASSGPSMQNVNVIPLGAFFGPDPLNGQTYPASNIPTAEQADYRPYPNYQNVNVPEHTNWANYNALQVALNKQSGALVYGANYTWSKALAVRGNWDTGNIGDPINAHHDYGIVSFDRPQAVNFNFSYQEGKLFRRNRELGWVLNSWELSGITSWQSGPDLAIANGSTSFGFSANAGYYTDSTLSTAINVPATASTWLGSSDYNLQPTVTCDPRKGLHSAILSGHQVSRQYANGNCFGVPALGTQGAWNLPDVRGPAFFKSDLSVYKDIQMTDRQNLQFRMAAFNFLNHPIPSFTNNSGNALNLTFSDPTCNKTTGVGGCYLTQSAAFAGLKLSNAGFGYTPYKFGVRIVEFGVKYNF